MFGFEKLEVWRLAIELSDRTYIFTRYFPSEERFGLTSQMRRSAVSIASNIGKGSGRGSRNDFARFIEISYGSLMELVTQSAIANRQNVLAADSFNEIYERSQQIGRMLSGLNSSLLGSSNK